MNLPRLEQTVSAIGSTFIDFDNILVALMNEFSHSRTDAQSKTLSIIGRIDGFLEKRGIQTIKRRAYCDWSQYPDAMSELYNMGVQPIHVKGNPGKNSADMELSLSVQEDVLRRDDIGVFVIVAGDRDYMPITNRVKELNKTLFFVSFRESLSGDLKSLVGAESVFYVDPKSGEIMGSDWKPAPEPKKVSKEVVKVERTEGISDDQMTALRAAIEAIDSVKGKFTTFRTGVFLMGYLATRLNHLTHLQRKDVFSWLVSQGFVKTDLHYDVYGTPFAVFSINEENEVVKKIRKATAAEPPPTAPAVSPSPTGTNSER
jgi:hypothetical protein